MFSEDFESTQPLDLRIQKRIRQKKPDFSARPHLSPFQFSPKLVPCLAVPIAPAVPLVQRSFNRSVEL